MSAPPPAPELGIVVALPTEAETLGAGRCRAGQTRDIAGARVAVAGIGRQRAAAAAAMLVGEGARALLSWGLAGGLVPELAAGDLVVADDVVVGRQRWSTDAAWRQRVHDGLRAAGLRVTCGNLWCADAPVTTVADKCALGNEGMLAADMESAAVAAVAARAGLPFAALKAVCDAHDRALPAAATQLLDADGRLHLRGLYDALRAGPGTWRPLRALRGDFLLARRSLRQAARTLPT